ncbi:MAG: tetratricopeptide repeat protein [Myxococcota bacterium]
MSGRLFLLVMLALGGCLSLRAPHGPRTLEEAAAAVPEGEARASIHLVARGEEALRAGELERAHALASRALRLEGDNGYAYLLLGQVAAASGELEGALRYLEEARLVFQISEPPNERWLARTLRLEAVLQERRGRPDEAARLRAQAEVLDPGGELAGSAQGPVIDSLR